MPKEHVQQLNMQNNQQYNITFNARSNWKSMTAENISFSRF